VISLVTLGSYLSALETEYNKALYKFTFFTFKRLQTAGAP